MRPDVRGAGCGRIRRVVLVAALAAVVIALGAPPTTAQDEPQGGDDVAQSPLPDLIIDSLTADFTQSGAQLLLTADVLNAAAGQADATNVTAEATGWETGQEPVPALGPQERAVVVLSFEVPDDARGQEALFRVEVDPAGAVIEESENNNVDRVAVAVPSGDPGDPDSDEEREDPHGDGEQEDLNDNGGQDPENGEESDEGPSDRSVDPLDVLRLVAAAASRGVGDLAAAALPAVPVAALIVLAAAVALAAVRALRDRVRPPPNVRMEARAAPPPDLRVRDVDDGRAVTVRIEPHHDAGDTTLEEVSE